MNGCQRMSTGSADVNDLNGCQWVAAQHGFTRVSTDVKGLNGCQRASMGVKGSHDLVGIEEANGLQWVSTRYPKQPSADRRRLTGRRFCSIPVN